MGPVCTGIHGETHTYRNVLTIKCAVVNLHPVGYEVSNLQRDINAESMYTKSDVHTEGHTHEGKYLQMEGDIHMEGNTHGGDTHTDGTYT